MRYVLKMVKVYYNLHKKCLSILKNGKVIAYRKKLYLKDVTFKVSESGRKRVLKNKQKNVHAFIIGKITNVRNFKYSKEITYNPYKFKHFVEKNTKKPIFKAGVCFIFNKNIYV